jgi:hypothetical protein
VVDFSSLSLLGPVESLPVPPLLMVMENIPPPDFGFGSGTLSVCTGAASFFTIFEGAALAAGAEGALEAGMGFDASTTALLTAGATDSLTLAFGNILANNPPFGEGGAGVFDGGATTTIDSLTEGPGLVTDLELGNILANNPPFGEGGAGAFGCGATTTIDSLTEGPGLVTDLELGNILANNPPFGEGEAGAFGCGALKSAFDGMTVSFGSDFFSTLLGASTTGAGLGAGATTATGGDSFGVTRTSAGLATSLATITGLLTTGSTLADSTGAEEGKRDSLMSVGSSLRVRDSHHGMGLPMASNIP